MSGVNQYDTCNKACQCICVEDSGIVLLLTPLPIFLSKIFRMIFFERSEGRRSCEARNSIAKNTKMIKKKTVRRPTTNFVHVKLFTVLSKFLIFLSLFQPPKTFSYVLHYPKLSNDVLRNFFSNKFFFFFSIFFFFRIFFL